MQNNSPLSIYLNVWKVLQQYYRHPIRHMLLLGILVASSTLMLVFVPYIMKQIVDLSQSGRASFSWEQLWQWENLYLLAACYALAWFGSNLLQHLSNRYSAFFLISIESALVYKGLENYFNLNFAEQRKIETGVINTDIWRGADAFGQLTFTCLFIMMPLLFEIVMMMVILAQNISLSFAVVFFFFALVTFALTLLIAIKSKDIFSVFYDAHNQINQFFIEKVQNHYDIQVNHAQAYALKQFDQRIQDYRIKKSKAHSRLVVLMLLQVFFVTVFLLGFMLFTVYLFEKNQVSTGDFVLIGSYIIGLTMPMLHVSQSVMRLKGDYISLKKFNSYFQLDQPKLQHTATTPHSSLYRFKHATLNLGKHHLSDFNLEIEPNKCYVIMGQTGIGKSSFMHYLIGIQQIQQGQLYYKNIDISQQFSSHIYPEIAVVSQTPVVYSGTLRENLVHNSRYQYSDAELMQYLDIFHLTGLLAKKQLGLDDELQDRYKSFSGGEKQRISILRALLKKPQCLIMDEPTAALDETTAVELMTVIRQQVGTIIMISHAPYAKQFADHVIDFDQLLL